MNEMRKLMETIATVAEEGDIGYTEGNNISKITNLLLKEYEQEVTRVLTSKLGGKTVELHVLAKHDGARGMGWKTIPVEVERVAYQEHDVDGPIYISTDGKEYHSHPDHNVKVVSKQLPKRMRGWPHLEQE